MDYADNQGFRDKKGRLWKMPALSAKEIEAIYDEHPVSEMLNRPFEEVEDPDQHVLATYRASLAFFSHLMADQLTEKGVSKEDFVESLSEEAIDFLNRLLKQGRRKR